MTIIANPIYDAVFKFMMEDNKVAKLLLSALLQKDILSLKMRRHEYTAMQQSRISLFRIDFSANIRNKDGSENLILIELQKTWLTTETLRFRQYLGTQYLNKENILSVGENPEVYGLPIISIYILGHKLGELTEPVVYVRRKYLDYNSNPIEKGVPDKFIESLTHDSIIVQIPFLKGRMQNRLERLLNVFDQDYRLRENEHLLEINEEDFSSDEQIIINRLMRAAIAPDIRRAMDVEDEILSEIEARDTRILQQDQVIEQKSQVIKEKSQVIKEKSQVIEQKSQVIEQKSQVIEQKSQEIELKSKEIEQKSQEIELKSKEIKQKSKEIEHQNKELNQQTEEIKRQTEKIERQTEKIERQTEKLEQQTEKLEQQTAEIERQKQFIHSMVNFLFSQGISIEKIAAQLSVPIDQIRKNLDQ